MTSGGGRRVDVDRLAEGVLAGNRAVLAQAITLVESTRLDHQEAAQELLTRLTTPSVASRRVGITGVPGAGKSTFIEALGLMLTGQGHRVAVLAIDPSSSRTGGSILGDKTRMARLSVEPNAFIRPSPTAGSLGGVARATREAIVLVEAAGYDVVLVETVGVGQSETLVAEMVDCFFVLLLARSGDSLQGIKKGIIELADVLAVNKADGEHAREAALAARELTGAMRLLTPVTSGWVPPVLTCSARDEVGLDAVWEAIEKHRALLESDGRLVAKRRRQQLGWMWATVEDRLLSRLRADEEVRRLVPALTRDLDAGTTTPTAAAQKILAAFH